MNNMPDEEQAEIASTIVNELEAKGVRLLALDFDQTIVSVHTSGCWRQGTQKLAEHVRPCFKHLIRAALESTLHLCVVTYSMQPTLIRDVLKMVLPKSNINKITIRASSKDWVQSPANLMGKQEHIAWITTDLYNMKHEIIQPHEILLMDDDAENVTLAEEFGHQAFEVTEDVELSAISDYVNRLDVKPREVVTIVE